jgi:hypothetical protein
MARMRTELLNWGHRCWDARWHPSGRFVRLFAPPGRARVCRSLRGMHQPGKKASGAAAEQKQGQGAGAVPPAPPPPPVPRGAGGRKAGVPNYNETEDKGPHAHVCRHCADGVVAARAELLDILEEMYKAQQIPIVGADAWNRCARGAPLTAQRRSRRSRCEPEWQIASTHGLPA